MNWLKTSGYPTQEYWEQNRRNNVLKNVIKDLSWHFNEDQEIQYIIQQLQNLIRE